MRFIALFFVVLAFNDALAQSSGLAVNINLASYHYERKDQNENNMGFGLEHSCVKNMYCSMGFFENSYRDNVVYLGVGKKWGALGLEAGIMNYDEYPVYILPYAQLGWFKIGATHRMLTFQYKFDL